MRVHLFFDNSTGPRRSEPGAMIDARRRLAQVGVRAGGCAEAVARGSRASTAPTAQAPLTNGHTPRAAVFQTAASVALALFAENFLTSTPIAVLGGPPDGCTITPRGQDWPNLAKTGQRWPNLDNGGQIWTANGQDFPLARLGKEHYPECKA